MTVLGDEWHTGISLFSCLGPSNLDFVCFLLLQWNTTGQVIYTELNFVELMILEAEKSKNMVISSAWLPVRFFFLLLTCQRAWHDETQQTHQSDNLKQRHANDNPLMHEWIDPSMRAWSRYFHKVQAVNTAALETKFQTQEVSGTHTSIACSYLSWWCVTLGIITLHRLRRWIMDK